ncbi:MAG: anthranilate phosphoribosyltransferase, partial [Gemmatimonadales bacterium]
AMRHVAPVRRALGVTTVMNMVGPLVNPAGAGRQVMGVSDLSRCGVIAETFARLGVAHALVVHAEIGMDEISPAGRTAVWEIRDGDIERWTLDPAAFGEDCADISTIGGGDPDANARRVEAVLDGEPDRPAKCAVLLNAAAAIHVALDVPFGQALERARDSLETGKARRVLDRLRALSPREAGAV